MIELQDNLANTIRKRRLKMNLSQEELAERIDKTPSFIGQLERGECMPKIETLQLLIHELGIDANALFIGESVDCDDLKEICNLAMLMDDKKLALLIEFAKVLLKTPL